MQKFKLCSLVVLSAVGSAGCTGRPQTTYGTPGMAANPPAYADNGLAGQYGAPPNAAANPASFSSMANAISNNPATAAVNRAFGGGQSAEAVVAASQVDAISLANQREAPTPSLFVAMGKLAERNGNIAQARQHFQKALSLAPNDVDALLAYGRMEDRQGKLGDALKLYDQAARTNPNHAKAQNDLGLCLARNGDFPAAVTALTRAVELEPNKKLYRNNLAVVLVELNRTDEALEQLSAANPPAVAHYNMGVLLHKGANVSAAAEHFAVAAQIDPSMTEATAWLTKLRGVAPETSEPALEAPTYPTTSDSYQEAYQGTAVTHPAPTYAAATPRVSYGQATASYPSMDRSYPARNTAPQTAAPYHADSTTSAPANESYDNGRQTYAEQHQSSYGTPRAEMPYEQDAYPQTDAAAPVPQYAPNYPTFPQQASPMRYPETSDTSQFAPGAAAQSAWPLQQPSQVPNVALGTPGAYPPSPPVVNNQYATPTYPSRLPPVQQAANGYLPTRR